MRRRLGVIAGAGAVVALVAGGVAVLWDEDLVPFTSADLCTATVDGHTVSLDPEQAWRVHAREELGVDPDDLPSPWVAAGSSFGAFVTGAAVPVLPYVFGVTTLLLPVENPAPRAALWGDWRAAPTDAIARRTSTGDTG